MKGRSAVWATAISVSALAPHAAPVALGLAIAKEGFDLLHAHMHRISVLAYIRATDAGTYLSVDPSGAAPGVVLQTSSSLAGSRGDEEGAFPVPADDKSRPTGAGPDPGEFCIKHRKDWTSYAAAHAGNLQDAEDAVSYAVEKILRYHAETGMLCPRKFDDPVAWAKKVIRNYIRSGHRRFRTERNYRPKLYSPQDDFGEDILDGILAKDGFSFIKDLKPRDHQIAIMYFIENLEPIDIARLLGKNNNTVRSSLHRTREKMRRQLGIANETKRPIPRETT